MISERDILIDTDYWPLGYILDMNCDAVVVKVKTIIQIGSGHTVHSHCFSSEGARRRPDF